MEQYTEAVEKQQQLLAAGAAGIVLLAVIAYVVWPIPSEAPSMQPSSDAKTSESAPSTSAKSGASSAPKGGSGTSVSSQRGPYETYAPEKVAYAKTGIVVIFFNSQSCEGCKLLDTDIRAHLKDIPKGVKILEANFDSDAVAKEKYGLMTPHVLIQVDSTGGRITQWSGSLNLRDIVGRLVH